MYYLYILQSKKSGKSYVGITHNIEKRLYEHNHGRVKSTKHKGPWYIIHIEEFLTLSEAKKREWFLKYTPQGGKLKKEILKMAGIPVA